MTNLPLERTIKGLGIMANQKLSTLEQRLSLLVAMPTETRRREACRQAIESIVEELKSLGLFVTTYPGQHPSLIATTKKTKKPKLMLVAHMDVVPANDPSQYEPKIIGNRFIGRGAYDMKFAIASYLEFLNNNTQNLKEYDLGIMITTDEEIAGDDGAGMILKEGWRAEVAFIPDSSTPWHIEEKSKGRMVIELEALGRSAHSSRPHEGTNALQKIINVVNELEEKYPIREPEDLTAITTNIGGGVADNQIPDHAKASIDLRAFDSVEMADASTFIQSSCRKHKVQYKIIQDKKPLILDKNNPHVKLFCKSYESVIYKKSRFNQAYGGTDGEWFARYNIPCIIISPRGSDFHGPQEYVNRDDLPIFYRLMVDFINRLHDIDTSKQPEMLGKSSLIRRVLERVRY